MACGCAREAVDLSSYAGLVRTWPAGREEVLKALQDRPPGESQRADRLGELFREVGCNKLETRSALGSQLPSVVCTLPGETDATIVIGANLDSSGSPEGVDSWTDASLLPVLYKALRGERRHHTFEFVAFASPNPTSLLGRRAWRSGAQHYVNRFAPWTVGRIQAIVNLVAIGRGEASAWILHAHPDLLLDLMSVARVMDVRLWESGLGSYEYASKRVMRGVPTITLHSRDGAIGSGARPGHSDLAHIDPDSYFSTYRLLATYLGYLDQSLRIRRDGTLP
jgi:hypothetical protein